MEKQSKREMELHKKFEFWNEATSFTRYLMVALFGAAFYNFSIDITLYLFFISILLNSFCYYSMKVILDDIVKDRIKYNYGNK